MMTRKYLHSLQMKEEKSFSATKNVWKSCKPRCSLIFSIASGCLFWCCNLNNFLSLFELFLRLAQTPFFLRLCVRSRECLNVQHTNFFYHEFSILMKFHNEKINFWITRLSEIRITKRNIFPNDFFPLSMWIVSVFSVEVEVPNRLNLKFCKHYSNPRMSWASFSASRNGHKYLDSLRLPSTSLLNIIAAIFHRVVHFSSI